MTATVVNSIKWFIDKSSFPDLYPQTKYRENISKDIYSNVNTMIRKDWERTGAVLQQAMDVVREEYEREECKQQTKTNQE